MVLKVEYELVTKKVPRRIIPVLRGLQAELVLEEGRRVTEAEVIGRAIQELARRPAQKKKKHSFFDIPPMKGGPKTNVAKDLDEVVYGDVNRS